MRASLAAQHYVCEALRFSDANFTELNHGKGRIFWAAEPVERCLCQEKTAI
jgi:hypothetical protein